jgi:beta-glucosidase
MEGMRNQVAKWFVAAAAFVIAGGDAGAREPTKLPYLNPSLAPAARASDLVRRMTLEEKASQLVNHARAIPRLGVPAYDWWSEALHGVLAKGATVFPEPVGLAATFDPAAIHQMAEVIGVEGRIKHDQAMKKGHSTTFEGLDFWAPNINIFRDPRWGRGQETYGEDPFLTGRMAVAYVTGLQGNDARYYRAISTPKHYAVHSGPEPTRHFADVDVSKHDMEDTYLPAFRAAVTEGRAGSVMCAYNSVNGEPACANEFLLQHRLRGAWKFGGYVVSDCSAVRDIFEGHRYRPSQPEASAISLMRGMDNECITFGEVTGKDDYQPYIDAVRKGYLPPSLIDRALVRLFTARMRLGMFDPPSIVPYARIDERELDSPAHRQLALRLAEKSMVLLKNDGVLPLKDPKRIAIVGPLAEQTPVLLGNYHGEPTHAVSVLEGMKAAFPGAQITYVPGTQFLSDRGDPIPATVLTAPNSQPGLTAEYRAGENFDSKATPVISQIEPSVRMSSLAVPAAVRGKAFNVHWAGTLTAPDTGDYRIGIKADGTARVLVAGRPIALTYGGTSMGRIRLEKGVPVKLEVSYASRSGADPQAQLIWHRVDDAPDPAAVVAARNADLVIAVVGLTSALEGEEMPVSEPGFQGGDRTNIDMPEPEEALVRSVASAGKPLVIVLMNGSALATRWEKQHANAVLEAWYPGEEGGRAIANTLSGANNPAGRLPVTFYEDVHQLPNFEDYSMKGRTYRYFSQTPLWPFGYGLSYTQFSYGPLVVKPTGTGIGRGICVETEVRNSGTVAGDEVAQLYLDFPDDPGAPRIALRGFKRLSLKPGETRTISFDLKPRDLSAVTLAGKRRVYPGAYRLSVGSGQPDTGVPGQSAAFRISQAIELPE